MCTKDQASCWLTLCRDILVSSVGIGDTRECSTHLNVSHAQDLMASVSELVENWLPMLAGKLLPQDELGPQDLGDVGPGVVVEVCQAAAGLAAEIGHEAQAAQLGRMMRSILCLRYLGVGVRAGDAGLHSLADLHVLGDALVDHAAPAHLGL